MWQAAVAQAVGQVADAALSRNQARSNRINQERFAKEGIQWRVADAKAAGVHPLYALGASVPSFTPVHAVTDFGGMGQDIGRAIKATQTGGEREASAMGALQLEHAQLQNELLRTQIASAQMRMSSGGQVGPPMPAAAVGSVEYEPRKIDSASAPGSPVAAGPAAPSMEPYAMEGFGTMLWPTAKFAQATEDMEMARYLSILSANLPDWGERSGLFPWLFEKQLQVEDWFKRSQADSARARDERAEALEALQNWFKGYLDWRDANRDRRRAAGAARFRSGGSSWGREAR